MTSAAVTSFPPQRTFAATPLSISEAHAWLNSYLTAAGLASDTKNNASTDASASNSADTAPTTVSAHAAAAAYLQPDAQMTATGPVQTQGMTSLTMHNLRRLQAGLNGRYDVQKMETDEGLGDEKFRGAVKNMGEIYGVADTKGQTEGMDADEGWQDKSEFEREQSDEIGEVDDREPGHGHVVTNGAISKAAAGQRGEVVKAARKKAKKERRKQARAERQREQD